MEKKSSFNVIFIVFLILMALISLIAGAFFVLAKTVIFLCALFIMQALYALSFAKRYKDRQFKIDLACGIEPATSQFRQIEFSKFVFVWILYLLILINIFPNLRTGNIFIDFIIDTIVLIIQILSSTIYSKYGFSRELYQKFTENPKFKLAHGYFLIAGAWFLYRVSEIDSELDKEDVEESKIHYDDREINRKRKNISATEDFFYTLFLRRKELGLKIKFSFFEIIVTIIFALILNSLLYIVILSNFYDKKEVVEKKVIKEEAKSNTTITPPQQTYNYNNNSNTTVEKKPEPAIQNGVGYDNNAEKFYDPYEYYNTDDGWRPDLQYYPNMKWGNLETGDKYTINVSMTKSLSCIRIQGNLVSLEKSVNCFPHVYVDGYEGDNYFFCKFFWVHINELTLNNGQTWGDMDMSLCQYIEKIKYDPTLSEKSYRDIYIFLKPQFKDVVRWHVLDAGYGVDKPFKISTEGGQYRISKYDEERFGECSN